jgi:two-component system, LuxR family, response regulator FixJ
MQPDGTIFIVDDDPAARASVAALVQSHDMGFRAFASAEEFLAAYKPDQQGCLVVDVRMSGMTGLQLQEQIKARGYHLPVIVITGYADVPLAVRAMRAGAVTFLEKPCAEMELWESIQLALDRSAQTNGRSRDDVRARRATLNPAELQVLEMLLIGKPNKAIALELGIGLRTVELRRANIMKKMQADSLAELVRLALLAEEHSSQPEIPPKRNAGTD